MADHLEAGAYTPDADLKLHSENAIRLICKPFQSHESGLPEWPKNAADEYARTGAAEKDRVVVLIAHNGRSGGTSNVIACLDFSGMTSKVIDEDFRHWADPEASKRGDDEAEVQGGHGNGGKCYMTQMFTDRAYVHTVKDGLANVYGTMGGSIHLGYFPSREAGKDYAVVDVRAELGKALAELGLNIGDLPLAALDALDRRSGFTLIVGRGAKGHDARVPAAPLFNDLIEHPQMRMTLEMCSVYALAQKKPYNDGEPLNLPVIPPMPGAEDPRVVDVPAELVDPVSGLEVSTTDDGKEPAGTLTLLTSETRMWRGAKKSRHNIVYKANSGYIGYKPIAEFDVTSSYRERIYGDCVLMALEPAKLNERAALAGSPLVRAVEGWITDEIEKYAKEFEARDQSKHNQEEKDALAQMNAALDSWKNDLLDKVLGEGGPGGDDGNDGRTRDRTPLPKRDPARIELSLTFYRAGVGIAMRPKLAAFDATNTHIQPPPVTWSSDNPAVADVDDAIRIINTHSPGEASIQCETFDKKITSNSVKLEIVDIASITLEPTDLEVPLGSRRHIDAVCTLASGEEARDVALVWIEDNPAVASVSASGNVFGFSEGVTEITASDDNAEADNAVGVTVVPSDGDGGTSTSQYPRVLISEIIPDPDTGERVVLSRDDPPVHQRVHDVERNIWWINSASPLAKLYIEGDGFGPESREWRIYHLERYIDVIVQIAMSQGPEAEDQMNVGDWIARWGERAADVQAAAADSLVAFIQDGLLP